MGRKLLHAVIAALTVVLPLAISVPPAHADNASEFFDLVNQLRASVGVPVLVADPTLAAAAQQWSAQMASKGQLADAPLSTLVPKGWTKLGENVGAGGSVQLVFNALVSNADHRAIMVDPAFKLTGVAVAPTTNHGPMYISEFLEDRGPAGATTTTTTAPKSTTTTSASTTTTTAATTTASSTTTSVASTAPSSTGTTGNTGSTIALGPAKNAGHGSSTWIFVAALAGVALAGLIGAGIAARRGRA